MSKADQMYTLVVLNDGETYSDISGCSIVVVNQAGMELLEAGYSLKDITPEAEIAVKFDDLPEAISKRILDELATEGGAE